MTEIEDRLRDAFRADAQTVRAETLRPFERPAGSDAKSTGQVRLVRQAAGRPGGSRVNVARRGRLVVPLAAALAVAVIAFGTVLVVPRILHTGHRHVAESTPFRPLKSFLTVTTSQAVFKDRYLVRYPVSTLQLRSTRHGRVITVLLRSLGMVDAVMTRAGNVIAVEDYGCRSVVLRINLRTGQAALVRKLPQAAVNIALSPDGRELAYVTYPASDPQPCGAVRQPPSPVRLPPANPGGPIQFLPSVLAIVNLDSGAVVSAASSDPGDPPGDPAWSPDGSMIAVVHSGEVQLLSATHPDFATARRIPPPRRCSYVTSTWTKTGLLAVLGCGSQDAALSPGTLVQLTTAGRRTSTWRLPTCIDGVGLHADPTARHVLLETDIGYGNARPCGFPRPGGTSIRVAVVRPGSLDTVAVFPQGRIVLGVTGW